MVTTSFLTREQELKIGQSTSKGEVVLGQVVKSREEIRSEVQKRKIKTGKKRKTKSIPVPIASKTILESQLKALPSTAAEPSATPKLTSPEKTQQAQKKLQQDLLRGKIQRGEITQTITPTGLPISFQKDVTKIGSGEPGERVLQVTPSESVVIKEKIPEVPAKKTASQKVRDVSVRLGEQFKSEIISGTPTDVKTVSPVEVVTRPAKTLVKGGLSVLTGAGASLIDFGVGTGKFTAFSTGFDPRRGIQRDIAVSQAGKALGRFGERLRPEQTRTLFGGLTGIGAEFAPEVATGGLLAVELGRRVKLQTIRSPTTVLGDVLAFQAIGKGVSLATKAISTELKAERAAAFLIKARKTPKGQTFKFQGVQRDFLGKPFSGELVVSRTGQITGFRQLGLDPTKPVRLLESQQFLSPALSIKPIPGLGNLVQRKLPATLLQKGLGVGPFRGSPLGKVGTQFAKTRTQLPDILGSGVLRTESGQAISAGFGSFKISKITGNVEFVRKVVKPTTQLTLGQSLQLKTPTELVAIKITKPGERVLKLFDFPSKKGQLRLFPDLQSSFGVFGEGSKLRTILPKFKFTSDTFIPQKAAVSQGLLTPTITFGGAVLRQTRKEITTPERSLITRQALLTKTEPIQQLKLISLSPSKVLRKRARGTLKRRAKARDKLILPSPVLPKPMQKLKLEPVIIPIQEQLIQQKPLKTITLQSFKRVRPRERILPRLKLNFDIGPKINLVKAFDVEVRKKGEFSKLGGGFTRIEALSKGAKRVEETSAATFRIIEKGFTQAKSSSPFEGLSNRFTRKNGDTFIERSKFRISTPGELKEITFAPRKKKKSKNKFDIFNNVGF